MKTLRWILRLAIAGVFGFAAVTKLADPGAFADAIQTYHLIPPRLAALVAVWLPWLELVAGLALLWPRHAPAAGRLLAALTALFLLALAQAWLRGIDLRCGCFGGDATVAGAGYLGPIGRDALLLGAIGTQLWLERRGAAAAPAGSGS